MQKALLAKLEVHWPGSMEDIWEGAEHNFQNPSFRPTQPCPPHSPQSTGMTDSSPNIQCDLLPWFLLTLFLFSLQSTDPYPSSKMQVRRSLLQEAFLDHLLIPIRGPLGCFSLVASASFSSNHPELSLPISRSSPICKSYPSPINLDSDPQQIPQVPCTGTGINMVTSLKGE